MYFVLKIAKIQKNMHNCFFGVKNVLGACNKPFPTYFDPSEVLEPFIEVTLKWMKIIDFGVQFGEGRVNSWSVMLMQNDQDEKCSA